MVDKPGPRPRRNLWVLPSEALPPGAAEFLELAGHVEPDGPGEAPQPEAEDVAPVVPLHGEAVPGIPDSPQAGQRAEDDPTLRAAGPPVDGDLDPAEHPGARIFLEMVERAETVRPLHAKDGGPDLGLADLLRPGADGGAEHSEALLTAIEQAMRHVNQSDHIDEDLRARLLDVFTDFAVRRPWKEEGAPPSGS